MQTLNEHIALFRSFANNHKQIADFGVGQRWELVESFLKEDGTLNTEREYPLMWVEFANTTVSGNEMFDNYNIFFADMVRFDEKNENEVLSDCKLMALDFMAFLQQGAIGNKQVLVKSATLEPFTEQFQDYLSGWILTVSIKQGYQYDYCSVPITGAPTGFGECQPVYIKDSSGNVIATVASGGSYTVVGGSCDDATAVLKDTAGTTISTTTIASGASANITAPDATITINGSAWGTVLSNGSEDIPVQNTTGTALGSKVGSIWTIADITFTDTDGTTSSKVAGVNVSATLIPALSCAQLNDADDGLTSAQRQIIQQVNTLKTGQTTSYRTGDDGDLEKGRLVDFFTLSCNNPFGNTNRFTDQSGGQTYSDDIVVDWATGLMWYKVPASGNWNAAIDGSLAASTGGYSWWLPSLNEIFTIINIEGGIAGQYFNYAPFSIAITTVSDSLWTSTTRLDATANAFLISTGGNIIRGADAKTLTRSYIYCRQFTYSGGSFS